MTVSAYGNNVPAGETSMDAVESRPKFTEKQLEVLNRNELEFLDRFVKKSSSKTGLENTIVKHLKFYDLSNSGFLDFYKFAKALERYMVGIHMSIVEQIFLRYSSNGTLLNYKDFARYIVRGDIRNDPDFFAHSQIDHKLYPERPGPKSAGELTHDYRNDADHRFIEEGKNYTYSDDRDASHHQHMGARKIRTTENGASVYSEEGQKKMAARLSNSPRANPVKMTNGQKVNMSSLSDFRDTLFRGGPDMVLEFISRLQDKDPKNTRNINYEAFLEVMESTVELMNQEIHGNNPNSSILLDERLLYEIFDAFRNPYSPSYVNYDEFLGEIKVPFSDERKNMVRAAFRKLDPHSEGFVELATLQQKYNVTRHPFVVMGLKESEALHDELFRTLSGFLGFRRALVLGNNKILWAKVSWEEFESYYALMNGCYDDATFLCLVERCWNVDKEVLDPKDAPPAAGISANQRLGLHHWQLNTLPSSHTYRNVGDIADLDSVFKDAREYISKKGGIRLATNVFKTFVLADDDIDDHIDSYEFRRAAKECGLRFTHDEEVDIFKILGLLVNKQGKEERLLPVFSFLTALQERLKPEREAVVQAAWTAIVNHPTNTNQQGDAVEPNLVKRCVNFARHPAVMRGEVRAPVLEREFLDTFSIFVNVTAARNEHGLLDYDCFKSYFQLYSSVIESDAYFGVVMRRIWGLHDSKESLVKDHIIGATESGSPAKTNHARYCRAMPRSASPTVKSQLHSALFNSERMVFMRNRNREFIEACDELRKTLTLRGMRGWVALIQALRERDDHSNGTVYKGQWLRIAKSLGLGLDNDDLDNVFKILSGQGGALDYISLLTAVKAKYDSELQMVAAEKGRELFERLAVEGPDSNHTQVVYIDSLVDMFDAKTYPLTVLRGKPPSESQKDYFAAVQLLSQRALVPNEVTFMTQENFMDLFELGIATFHDCDEMSLFCQSAFGMEL